GRTSNTSRTCAARRSASRSPRPSSWCETSTSEKENEMDLSYAEKLDKLQIRIRAHKEFANFDVSTWIDEFCARAPRRRILDIGCGSGNHLELYARHVGPSGRVVGLAGEP